MCHNRRTHVGSAARSVASTSHIVSWPSNYDYLELMRMNENEQFNQQMTPRQTILRMLGEIKDRATNEEREEIISLIIDRDTRLATECDALRSLLKEALDAWENALGFNPEIDAKLDRERIAELRSRVI
jgi:hypothetical protein